LVNSGIIVMHLKGKQMKLTVRTESLREVRKALMVPGVIYGKSIDSISVQANDKEFKEALKTFGKSMTFKAELDGTSHFVYIKKVSTNILQPKDIIHFELHAVAAKEMMSASIPIVLIGKEEFQTGAVYVQQELDFIHCEFLPGEGLSKIEVNVSGLKRGAQICVRDLNVGHGIVFKESLDQVIVMIREHTIVEEKPAVKVAPVVSVAPAASKPSDRKEKETRK
jgi:large subunit ribosomal protein L25